MSGVSDKLSILADEEEESKAPPSYSWYTTIGGQSMSEKVILIQFMLTLSHWTLNNYFDSSKESVDSTVVKVYTRRWYILGIFSVLACHQV